MLRETHALVKTDWRNAFDTFHRTELMKVPHKGAPQLAPLIDHEYGEPNIYIQWAHGQPNSDAFGGHSREKHKHHAITGKQREKDEANAGEAR